MLNTLNRLGLFNEPTSSSVKYPLEGCYSFIDWAVLIFNRQRFQLSYEQNSMFDARIHSSVRNEDPENGKVLSFIYGCPVVCIFQQNIQEIFRTMEHRTKYVGNSILPPRKCLKYFFHSKKLIWQNPIDSLWNRFLDFVLFHSFLNFLSFIFSALLLFSYSFLFPFVFLNLTFLSILFFQFF